MVTITDNKIIIEIPTASGAEELLSIQKGLIYLLQEKSPDSGTKDLENSVLGLLNATLLLPNQIKTTEKKQ